MASEKELALDEFKKFLKECPRPMLDSWEAVCTAFFTLEQAGAFERFDAMRKLPANGQLAMSQAIGEEVDQRRENEMAVLVAHTLEQGEDQCEKDLGLFQYESEAVRWQMLAIRCARLVKLVHLQAPDTFLKEGLELILKTAAAKIVEKGNP